MAFTLAALRSPRSLSLAASAGSGALLALAGPPIDAPPLAWLALIALAYLLGRDAHDPSRSRTRLQRAFEGGARGLAFGMAANMLGQRFVPDVIARFTPLPWAVGLVALALLGWAQGLVWWIVGAARTQLVRVGIPSWGAFALAVYAGTFVPSVFPWTPAGVIAPWPSLVQLADAIGERGVSALLALSAGLAAEIARRPRRAWAHAFASGALLGALAAHGRWRIAAIEALRAQAKVATIGLVQPSIGATDRWHAENAPAILDKLTALTKSAERRGAELTVWTESAYPYVLSHAARRTPIGAWAILQPDVRGPVIAGAVLSAGHGDSFNSAILATADGAVSAPYDKLHLLWFGESVPLAAELPWIRRTFARGVGLVPGERAVLLESGNVRAGILICYEDTLPGAGREAAAERPNLLVDISNDAWFAGSQESDIHLAFATMRAIEIRRDLVRAVNFGPTSWIDAAGLVRARYASAIPGTLITTPALLELPPTFYARFGDLPLFLACVLLVLARAALIRRAGGKAGD